MTEFTNYWGNYPGIIKGAVVMAHQGLILAAHVPKCHVWCHWRQTWDNTSWHANKGDFKATVEGRQFGQAIIFRNQSKCHIAFMCCEKCYTNWFDWSNFDSPCPYSLSLHGKEWLIFCKITPFIKLLFHLLIWFSLSRAQVDPALEQKQTKDEFRIAYLLLLCHVFIWQI